MDKKELVTYIIATVLLIIGCFLICFWCEIFNIGSLSIGVICTWVGVMIFGNNFERDEP